MNHDTRSDVQIKNCLFKGSGMDKPECPDCPEDGDYSVTVGASRKTLLATRPAKWDVDGNRHPQVDPNTIKTDYSCSNGHTWTESKRADSRYEEKMAAREEAGFGEDDTQQ